ncbi:hypothetical protein DNTS_004882 [Danionella cerebrum]|uniref:Optineurin n=1 Tax=Danionella cerebrum TaxID=2873325 RepID=A0A553MQJ6_9TELE|nr:hypothetical protein DNTS_004882 [Danionella translucida]
MPILMIRGRCVFRSSLTSRPGSAAFSKTSSCAQEEYARLRSMASGSLMNGDINHPHGSVSGNVGSLEETLQQMNTLIKENRDLKEALKQTNLTMKERFEGLSAWKEKQKEERDFLEQRLEEAKTRLNSMDAENAGLNKRVIELEKNGAESLHSELEMLRGQIARLQAEKHDLVALNSELQLKMGQGSPSDSFIEIRIAEDDLKVTQELPGALKEPSAFSMPKAESEEQTVRQLLHSLRAETDEKERLQLTLQEAQCRIAELMTGQEHNDSCAQTSLPVENTVGLSSFARC